MVPAMTVGSTSRLAGPFAGTGAEAINPVSFKVTAEADLLVLRDGGELALTADYTVSLNADQDANPGGTVTVLAAANTLGAIFYITTDMAVSQPTVLPAQDAWHPKVVERALDRLAMLSQQIYEKLARAIVVPRGSDAPEMPIPTEESVIGFNASGDLELFPKADFKGDGGDPGPAMDPEAFYDMLDDMLVAGANCTITRDPALNTFTVTITSTAAYTSENMQDDLSAALIDGTGIDKSYDDGAGTLTVSLDDAYLIERVQDIVGALASGTSPITVTYNDGAGTWAFALTQSALKPTESLIVAASDESTALSVGAGKVTFRMPYAFTLSAVRASLKTAQTSGSIFTVDLNEGGVSLLSTKLTIDNGEKTSTTALTPAVISDAALADDAEITVDIDQVGDGTAKGLKIVLIGSRT